MDMEMHGTPWLDKPLILGNYREFECDLNSTELCNYVQGYWRFWYEADHRYALPTVGLFCAILAVFTLAMIATRLLPARLLHNTALKRTLAIARYASYKTFRVRKLDWNSAPLGVLALGVLGAIFFFCMTLVPRPYYWPNTDTVNFGNSPPIATRSGWMSLACLPFIFVTASKTNPITFLTGVSHEKLQVFHRWISYACFVLALIHTFPFIVYNIQTSTMVEQWNTSVFYWTGVVALLAQGWLTFASISPLRHLGYEWFKFSHFLAALVFTLFLFFHCDSTLSSWDYFIATGILFAVTWLFRHGRQYLKNGLRHRASLSTTQNGWVRVQIPTSLKWHVGQHFFVRFLDSGLNMGATHPFSACSLSSDSGSELVLYIKPKSGQTARLLEHAEMQAQKSIRVILDGPYGGVDEHKLRQCTRQLVIAGGSGSGWTLPLVADFLRRVTKTTVAEKGSIHLTVVLVCRQIATRQFYKQAIRDLLREDNASQVADAITVHVFVTDETGQDPASITASSPDSLSEKHTQDLEKSADARVMSSSSDESTSSSTHDLIFRQNLGRPDLVRVVEEEVLDCTGNDQLGVYVCGPASMQHTVANAVAARQLDIVKKGGNAVYLHMEHFSWA